MLVLAVAVLLAWAASGQTSGYLDPDSPEPQGARALARLLADQGVEVLAVRTADEAVAAAGPATTVLVTETGPLNDAMLARVAAAETDVVVLVEPDPGALEVLAPGVGVAGVEPVESRPPGCTDPVASRSGSALTGGLTFATSGSGVGCYPVAGAASVLLVPASGDRPDTVVLGSGTALTNDRIADDGNAALTMGLLGSQPRLVWYRPSLTDPLLTPDDVGVPLEDLVPPWVPLGAGWLVLAAGVTALWRGRRLGPVVTEPLPVVVRAAEATEGRARLYRRSHARDRAATALRDCGPGPAGRGAGDPRAARPDGRRRRRGRPDRPRARRGRRAAARPGPPRRRRPRPARPRPARPRHGGDRR